MKFNFKKIASVLTSGIMLASTVGFAAAASYPEPFVTGGAEDAAIVVGDAAANSDWIAAINLQTKLNALVTSGGTGTTVTGTAWQVKTSSDTLEMGESLYDVEKYIDKDSLPLLENGEVSNEKGTAKYSQYLYFYDTASSMVTYQQDSNTDEIGLMFKVADGEVIATYVMDFTSSFDSDITSANVLEDIEDEDISLLGKSYTITTAKNASTGVQMTLMSGTDKVTVSNGEVVTAGGKEISVIVSSSTAAQFTVDGETTTKLNEGDTYKFKDGTYIGVSDITYQSFQGGIMQATIYVGADKITMNNGSAMEVNAEKIDEAMVYWTSTISAGDISITELKINMTAEDDLWVHEEGKLSEANDLDEPQVLIGQNWDIEYKGLETQNQEDLKLYPTGSDRDYKLTFNNYNGDKIEMPLLFSNNTGIYFGEKEAYELVLNANMTGRNAPQNISKNQYFILSTAEPRTAGNNARSFLVQYKGSDKTTDSDPKVKFDVIGVELGREVTLATDGTFNIKLGGTTFNFVNQSTGTSKDFQIALNAPDYSTNSTNNETSIYMRTQYNALINISDDVYNRTGAGQASFLRINVTVDDNSRDDDDSPLGSMTIFSARFNLTTDGDAAVTLGGDASWVSDPDDSNVKYYITTYGAEIKDTNPTGSPNTVEVKIPESFAKPLVYVSSGEITVTPGSTGGAGGSLLVVKDSEVSSVKTKNLIVVGGSCINTVAAKILGFSTPTCEADFTAATDAGAGQYIIKVVKASAAVTGGSDEKVAMLVAGYNAADTENAVDYVIDEKPETVVDTKIIGPITA